MQRQLTHQQESAIAKLQRLRVGALFMACGTGKPQTAAALVNSIDDADLLMWICPCQTKENLQEELGLCSLKYTPKIIGIESLVSDRIYLDALETVKKSRRSVLICDESLKIKNISAKRTKKLLELSKHAYYKLILNGTPITKNIMDIYCQMEFLSPKILDCSYREYKRRYCVIAQKKVGRQVVSEWIKSEANAARTDTKPTTTTGTVKMIVKIKCTHCNEEIELEIAPPKKRKKVELSEEVKKARQEHMKKVRRNRSKE